MLEDKNIVITGAGSGIGRATSLLAAGYGANLVCVDVTNDAEERQLRSMQRRFWISAACSRPLLVLAMVPMIGLQMPGWMSPRLIVTTRCRVCLAS